MNFLGIGMAELLVIGIIAVMVVGPERMVEFSRTAGRLLGKLRRETDSITKEFREAISTFDDVAKVADEAKTALNEVTSEVNQATRVVQQTAREVQNGAREVQKSVVDARAAVMGTTVAAKSTPAAATPKPTLSPPPPVPTPKPSVKPILDSETITVTPRVARGALPTDEATEVGLADVVPENPADIAPVEVQLPTLMLEEADLAAQPEPTPQPEAIAPLTEAQPTGTEDASEEGQG